MEKQTGISRKLLDLEKLLPGRVITNPVALIAYERDAGLDAGKPDGVVLPTCLEDVQLISHWATANQVALIMRGAGTGLSGGAVAEQGGVIVAFPKMNRVLEFDPTGRSVVVEPGVVNQVLDEMVRKEGFHFPPDPSSGRSATLGGNVAENAGGPHCFKYGVTTNYLTGLEVVLSNGHTLQLGGQALDAPEYDFVGLLAGSEGALGIITKITARVIAAPPAVMTLLATFDSVEQAGKAVSAVIAGGLMPATMEMMDQKTIRIIEDFAHAGLPTEAGAALIIETDGYPASVGPQMDEIVAILDQYGAGKLRLAKTEAERAQIWYARKSAAGAFARLAPAVITIDCTVPRSKLAITLAEINRICDAAGLRVGFVFHAGDGNLHPLILIEKPGDTELLRRVRQVNRQIVEWCIAQDGSLTGEHGVGIEKRDYMPIMFSPEELQVMREIKQVFDPAGLLNPGKILPPELPLLPKVGTPALSPGMYRSPATIEEASDVIRAWSAAGIGYTLRGGGTKSGFPAESTATCSTRQLSGITQCVLEDMYVRVKAGTSLADLQTELHSQGMWVPLASPWRGATLGGIAATNFNAPLRMRYGALRDLILEARVVLPDGRCIRAGRPVVKNVAGYDLPKLFVGSRGSLGLITELTLKLAPLPRRRESLVVSLDRMDQGLKIGMDLLRVCLVGSAMLLCRGCNLPGVSSEYALIYTVEGHPEDVCAEFAQAHKIILANQDNPIQTDAEFSGSQAWQDWLAGGPADIPLLRAGVRVKDLGRLLAEPGVARSEAGFIADLASGLLYIRTWDWRTLSQASHKLGGYVVTLKESVKGVEPGKDEAQTRELMRTLKSRWDPKGLCNPGVLI